MNNPYAPPAMHPNAAPSPYGAPSSTGPLPWTASGLLNMAWSRFKGAPGLLIGAIFVTIIAGQAPAMCPRALAASGVMQEGDLSFALVAFAATVVGWVLNAFMQAGLMRVNLKVARGEAASFSDVFSGGTWFLPLLGATILTSIATALGFLFFIVPGVILAIGFMFSSHFIVDQNMGPLEAMSASWAATKGQRLDLFGFCFLLFLVVLAGAAACGFGLLVAVPVTSLSTAVAYLHLSGRLNASNDNPAGPGAFSGSHPAPGGYGAYGPPGTYGNPPAGGFGGYGGGAA